MFKTVSRTVSVFVLTVLLPEIAFAQEAPVNILFFSKSESFEHSCIKWVDGKSHVDGVLQKLAPLLNAKITSAKDGGVLNADNLRNYQLVIFYTQGDLTKPGKDGSAPMAENGVADLIAWIESGGAFLGFHSVTDTLRTPPNAPVTPFVEMVGGEFAGHGKQFEGIVRTVDTQHPIIAASHFPSEFRILDEWYTFTNLNTAGIHVLALLDPGAEREKQDMYNIASYPIMWVRELGKGRVYVNGMGHREDVWENTAFQGLVIAAAKWALGEGAAAAGPNFGGVVPGPSVSGATK